MNNLKGKNCFKLHFKYHQKKNLKIILTKVKNLHPKLGNTDKRNWKKTNKWKYMPAHGLE